MSGEHEELAKACKEFAAEGWGDEAERVARALLDNQYVTTVDDQGDRRYWKVKTGAGQGLNWSGDVANASFASTVEKKLFFPTSS